jgi:hypothetical protein
MRPVLAFLAVFAVAFPAVAGDGLGISRDRAIRFFEKPDYELKFEIAPAAGVYTRYLGQSPDGIFAAELIGPRSNLVKATAMTAVTDERVRDSVVFLMAAALVFSPNWDGANKWVFEVLKEIGKKRLVEMSRDGRRYAVRRFGSGVVMLIVDSTSSPF